MKSRTKDMIIIALDVAIAIVLDYIKTFLPLNMPSGGSINIALIPICFVSFHLGVKKGVLCGFLWWLVSSLMGLNSWYLSFKQYLFDYIIPSSIIGLSAIFYKKKNTMEISIGIILMMFIRTFVLCFSGAIFWPGDLASNSLAAWVFSISYNLPYSLLTTLMLLIVIPILLKSLKTLL